MDIINTITHNFATRIGLLADDETSRRLDNVDLDLKNIAHGTRLVTRFTHNRNRGDVATVREGLR